MPFHLNIFINCPFDDDYYPLLKPLLFTVVFCGLKPRLSETRDSDSIRIRQIQGLIEDSKFSIHDLSRIEGLRDGDLPRFNMPFELGLDLGCKRYSNSNKRCLILEEQPYRYKQVLSDISGQDIKSHNNEPIMMVKAVRDWIYTVRPRKKLRSYMVIWDLYNEFLYDFDKEMKAEKMNPEKMWEIPFSELIILMSKWINSKF